MNRRARDLAEAMTWPRGDSLEELDALLRKVLEPELAALEATVLRIRQVVDRVAAEPGRFPTRVVVVGPEGDVERSEVEGWVPGDSLEVVGGGEEEPVVHGYPPAEGHALVRGDVLDWLEQGVADLRRWLFEETRPAETVEALAQVLAALPERVLDELERRREGWGEELAEREAWRQGVLAFLREEAERAAAVGPAGEVGEQG